MSNFWDFFAGFRIFGSRDFIDSGWKMIEALRSDLNLWKESEFTAGVLKKRDSSAGFK